MLEWYRYLKVSLGLVSHCLMHQCFAVKKWLSQLTGSLMRSAHSKPATNCDITRLRRAFSAYPDTMPGMKELLALAPEKLQPAALLPLSIPWSRIT